MCKICLKYPSVQVKSDGYLFLTDFSWVKQPCDNFFFGMYTSIDGEGKSPKEFEIFKFYIDKAPEDAFEIFHIPNYLMFKVSKHFCGRQPKLFILRSTSFMVKYFFSYFQNQKPQSYQKLGIFFMKKFYEKQLKIENLVDRNWSPNSLFI